MSTSDIKLLLSGYFKDIDHSQPVGLKFFGIWNDLESLLGMDFDLVTEYGLAGYAQDSFN